MAVGPAAMEPPLLVPMNSVGYRGFVQLGQMVNMPIVGVEKIQILINFEIEFGN